MRVSSLPQITCSSYKGDLAKCLAVLKPEGQQPLVLAASASHGQ